MEFRPLLARIAAAGTAALLLGTSAFAQEACTAYTVKDGDTLGSIAQAAYGTGDYQNIFNANREVIGDNPAGLSSGTVLNLPCEDGSIAGDATAAQIIEEQNKIAASKPKSNAYEPPHEVPCRRQPLRPVQRRGLEGGTASLSARRKRPRCIGAATPVTTRRPCQRLGLAPRYAPAHRRLRCGPWLVHAELRETRPPERLDALPLRSVRLHPACL